MRISPIVRTGLAGCAATALVLAASASAAVAAAPLPLTLSSTGGPSGGGNSITATVNATAAVPAPFPAGTQPVVQFQYSGTGSTACSAKARAVSQITGTATTLVAGVLTVKPDDVLRLSSTKIAFTVPSAAYPATVDGQPSTINTGGLALLPGQVATKWLVCVYDSASTTDSTLIANAAYALAVRPVITSILPATAPVYGGSTITVNGFGFGGTTPAASATIDGVPLTNLKVSPNGNSFTATTPAHAAGPGFILAVRTVGGLVSSGDPDNNGLPEDNDPATADAAIPFTFSNGITVAPDTAPAGSKVSIDIRGVGFDKLTFSKSPTAAPTDATAHVFLVRDAYSPGANRGVQECKGVLVVSSVEIICTIDLGADQLSPADSSTVSGSPVAEGTYTVTVVANGSPAATADAAAASVVTSGATFTVGAY